MKILVQTHMRNNAQLFSEYRKIEEAGLTPVSYGYIRNEDGSITIVGLEDVDLDEPVFNRASVQILKMHFVEGRKFKGHIPKGFFDTLVYNPNTFNIQNMPEHELMMNKYPGKYEFMTLKEALYRVNDVDTFYKPNSDLKMINGSVIKKGELLIDKENIDESSEYMMTINILKSTNIVNIVEEVRCFVVNNKAITASRYIINGNVKAERLNKSEELFYLNCANKYINEYYSPANCFTIDLARLDNGTIAIIEYNCINSSGMYEINSTALFTSLMEHFK